MAKLNSKAVRVLTRMVEAGFDTEKAIQSMTMDDILKLPNINVSDIAMINDLQKAVKAGKVVEFLAVQEKEAVKKTCELQAYGEQ